MMSNHRSRHVLNRLPVPIVLIFALALGALATEREQDIGLGPKPFVAQSIPRAFRNQTITIKHGAFEFAPSLRYTYSPEGRNPLTGRTISSIAADFTPDFALTEPVRKPPVLLFPERITAKHSGRTAMMVTAIEIREGDRTSALIETDVLLTEDHRQLRLPLRRPVADWKTLRVLYHLRLLMEDEGGELRAIPDLADERRTIVWTPDAYQVTLEPAQTPGRPPRPAELRPAGAGLMVSPEIVSIGETFTAHVIFQNLGDLSSETMVAAWRYGAVSLEETIPSVPPGRTVSCRFSDLARMNENRVEFLISNQHLTTEFTPIARPLLEILAARVEENFTDEPLTLRLVIRNRGYGVAAAPRLGLTDGGAHETTVTLASLSPGDKTTLSLQWNDPLPDSFFLALNLSAASAEETGLVLSVSRAARPRARIGIERLSFNASDEIGGPMRLVATIANTGTIEGMTTLRLGAVQISSGETLLSHSWTGRIPAGERIEIVTEVAPQEPGLLRGQATMENGPEEFVIIDLPPPVATAPEGAILAPLVRTDQPPGGRIARRIERGMTWRASPLPDPDEIDSGPILSLSLLTWKRTATGDWTTIRTRENRPVARLTISGGGGRERFDVSAGETSFRLPLTKRLLSETVLLTIEPINGAAVFLIGPPTLVLTPSAAEHGAILDVAARGGAIQARITNRGQLIRAASITVSAASAGTEFFNEQVAIAPGEETTLRLPLPPNAPGRHLVTLTLPRAVMPAGPTFSVLVPPDPLPELWVGSPRHGLTGGAAAYLVLPIEVAGAAAPGLLVDAFESSVAITTVGVPITVPAGETAIFLLPAAPGDTTRATHLRVDYGPMTIERRVPPSSSVGRLHRLRIIDLGGDSAATDREIILRYERRGDGAAAPGGTVKLAVNGLLRAAQNVPALETGQAYIAGFTFLPGGTTDGRLNVVLFEELSETHLLLDQLTTTTIPGGGGPTRADRGWTAPLLVAAALPAPETGSVYLRLAARAWEAGAFLMRRTGAPLPPITPDAARRLDEVAAETTAISRIAYREKLDEFLAQWQTAAILLGGARLPVTVETRHLDALSRALDALATIAVDPAVIDRGRVEAVLERMIRPIDLILGARIERPGEGDSRNERR